MENDESKQNVVFDNAQIVKSQDIELVPVFMEPKLPPSEKNQILNIERSSLQPEIIKNSPSLKLNKQNTLSLSDYEIKYAGRQVDWENEF